MSNPIIPEDATPGDTWEHVDENGTWVATLQRSGAVTLSNHVPSQQYIDNLPPPPPPPPDVGGLKTAVYSQNGLGQSLARQLVRDYPEIMDGLNQEAWEFVHLGMASALQDEIITQDDYDLLITLMGQYNIPVPEQE